MFGLTDLSFYFFFLLFFPIIFISWTIPGLLILPKTAHRQLFFRFILATVLGLALWGMQGFVFGYLHARWLTFGYLLVTSLFFLKKIRTYLPRVSLKLASIDLIAICFILLGSVIQLSTVITSGLKTAEGIYFHQINAHDGVFYIALIQELVYRFPPEQPGAAGLPVTNYHYWSNLILAELARVWHLPVIHLYFQFIPSLLAPLLGIVMWIIVKEISGSRMAARLGVFFHFFSADLTYVFMWLWHRQLSFSTITIDNGAIQFINMPQAFAKLLFLTGLFFFTKWLRTHHKQFGVLTVINFALLVGFKVYFGIASALGMCIVFAFEWIRTFWKTSSRSWVVRWQTTTRTHLFFATLLIAFALISAVIYFPVNKNSGGLFFVPIAWPKLLLNSEKLNWNEWWLRLQVYEAEHSLPHLIVWNAVAVMVFFVVIYSSRLLGFFILPSTVKKIGGSIYLFLISIVIFCTVVGMNFLQTSGGYNIFNFFIVALTVLSILSALALGEFLQKKRAVFILPIFLLLCLPLPRIVYTSVNFIQTAIEKNNSTLVSTAEIQALTFLKKEHPEIRVIQSHIEAPLENRTPYLSFFSHTQGYYSGRAILGDHNQPVAERERLIRYLFKNPDSDRTVQLMNWYGIDALYLQKPHWQGDQHLPFRIRYSAFKKLYENEEVIILIPRNENERLPRLTSFNIAESEEW